MEESMNTSRRTRKEAKPVERLRVQLDFSSDAYERLQNLKNMADARTNAEVVRNALRIYEWFLNQRRDHWRVQVTKDDTVKEVELIHL